MPEPPAAGSAPSVRRVPGRHGLDVARAGLPPVSLATPSPDGTVVRTPSRPDFHDGNVTDLDRPPAPTDLDRLLRRAEDQARAVGAARVRLRWEEPLAPDAPPGVVPAVGPALAAALAERGLALGTLVVLLAGADASGAVDDVPVGVELLGPLAASGDAALERRWHGVAVLQRYADGDDPTAWRAADGGFAAWRHGVRRALALEGRAWVWLAMRQGMPAGTVTLVDDLRGTAVLEDLVVHPTHRGRGIAAALVRRAASFLDAGWGPSAPRLGSVVEPGSTSERLHRRAGFHPHAVVRVAERPLADPSGRGREGPRG